MYCPDCGTQNEAGARFCANCGAELSVRAPRHAASHLDSNGDGIPDALEAPTTLVGAAAPTTDATARSIPSRPMKIEAAT